MSAITKEFYTRFAPVLNEPGWWETNAAGYGNVFFRNTIHQSPGVEITVGIVVCPSSWYYCASFSTPGSMRGIDVPRLPVETPWAEVHGYYLNHGLVAYAAYKEDLDRRIEAHDTRIAKLKANTGSN